MSDNDNDIDALLFELRQEDKTCKYAALTALVAERDALQATANADAEDRRQYIDAWSNWIHLKSELGIAEWLHAYADAIPHPPRDGVEAKHRIMNHLDQRMRDAAERIDVDSQRIAELERQLDAMRKQRDEARDYSIALQRAIEHHCRGVAVPPEIAANCPHHAQMLNEHLARKEGGGA